MKLGSRELILAGPVEQFDVGELVVEEGVDGLHVVCDLAEEGWFGHVSF